MPHGYDFPTGADAWGVMSFGQERGARNLNVAARLKHRVSIEKARAELQAIEADLSRSYPTENSVLRHCNRRGRRIGARSSASEPCRRYGD